jgi:hypothetical protein
MSEKKTKLMQDAEKAIAKHRTLGGLIRQGKPKLTKKGWR